MDQESSAPLFVDLVDGGLVYTDVVERLAGRLELAKRAADIPLGVGWVGAECDDRRIGSAVDDLLHCCVRRHVADVGVLRRHVVAVFEDQTREETEVALRAQAKRNALSLQIRRRLDIRILADEELALAPECLAEQKLERNGDRLRQEFLDLWLAAMRREQDDCVFGAEYSVLPP